MVWVDCLQFLFHSSGKVVNVCFVAHKKLLVASLCPHWAFGNQSIDNSDFHTLVLFSAYETPYRLPYTLSFRVTVWPRCSSWSQNCWAQVIYLPASAAQAPGATYVCCSSLLASLCYLKLASSVSSACSNFKAAPLPWDFSAGLRRVVDVFRFLPVSVEWWLWFIFFKALYMLNWKLETKLGVWGFWFVCLGLGFQVLCRECGGGEWLSMFVSFWFWARVSRCSPNWPRTLYVAQAGLQLIGHLPRPAGNTGVYHRTRLGSEVLKYFIEFISETTWAGLCHVAASHLLMPSFYLFYYIHIFPSSWAHFRSCSLWEFFYFILLF